MAYDPQQKTPSNSTIRHFFGDAANRYSPPQNLEPELKFIVPDASYFSKLVTTLAHSPKILARADFGVVSNDYDLFSMGLDTVNEQGFPTQLVAKSDHQYRIRAGVRDTFDDRYLSEMEATIKCRKNGISDGRFEIETDKGDLSKSNIGDALRALKKKDKALRKQHENTGKPYKALPPEFSHIADKDLRVETLCMTSRSSYYFVLKVENGFQAVYHACADANVFMTANAGDIAGTDFEAEFEITEIRLDKPLEGSPKEIDRQIEEKILQAQETLKTMLLDAHGHDIHESPASKLVRSVHATIKNSDFLGPANNKPSDLKYHANQWQLLWNIKPDYFLKKSSFEMLQEHRKYLPRSESLLANIPSPTILSPAAKAS